MCKECKLTMEDLEVMDIGQAIDYIDHYVSMKEKKNKSNNSQVREANQNDFDNF